MKRYILGCICLGATAGFLVGASQSPVVQYVLPLLFALIGGAAGIFAIKAPSSKTTDDKLRIAGTTTIALSVPFLIATIYGSLVRSDAGIASLLPLWAPEKQASVLSSEVLETLSANDAISLLLVNQNLKLVGVSDQDRIETIAHAIKTRSMILKKFEDHSVALLDVARRLVNVLRDAARNDPSRYDEASFLIVLIELENLIHAYEAQGASTSSKLRVARKVAASLREAEDDYLRAFLLSNKEATKLSYTLNDLLSVAPAENILFDDVKDALTDAVKAVGAKTAALTEQPGGYRGLASTDSPDR